MPKEECGLTLLAVQEANPSHQASVSRGPSYSWDLQNDRSQSIDVDVRVDGDGDVDIDADVSEH